MAHLFFGLSKLDGKLSRYAERYDLLELQLGDSSTPAAAKLARWREQVPPAFAFSIVLPGAVASLRPGAGLDEALDASLDAARALQARAILLATPPDVRPTAQNRRRLIQIGRRLPAAGYLLGWQPAGIWELEDAFATAEEAGLLPVLDAARDPLPGGPVVYTRIRTLGGASQLGEASLGRIADQVRGRREAFVVVEGPSGARIKSGLEALLQREPTRPLPATVFRPNRALGLLDDEEQ